MGSSRVGGDLASSLGSCDVSKSACPTRNDGGAGNLIFRGGSRGEIHAIPVCAHRRGLADGLSGKSRSVARIDSGALTVPFGLGPRLEAWMCLTTKGPCGVREHPPAFVCELRDWARWRRGV